MSQVWNGFRLGKVTCPGGFNEKVLNTLKTIVMLFPPSNYTL